MVCVANTSDGLAVRDTLMGKGADFGDKSDAPRLGMCGCLSLAFYQPVRPLSRSWIARTHATHLTLTPL
jgi:hypothetical protein